MLRFRNLERRTSKNVTNDPFGLTVVYEPSQDRSVDLIFVHGLGGSSRATWTHPQNPHSFWPKEWLPAEPAISSARILTFGYNATFGRHMCNTWDFSKSLLSEMRLARNEHAEELGLGQVSFLGDETKILDSWQALEADHLRSPFTRGSCN